MFTILRKTKRRIKRLLKVQTGSRQRTEQTGGSIAVKYIMLGAAATLIGLFYPGEHAYVPYDMPRVGSFAHENILAPFPIKVQKTDRDLADERKRVSDQVPLVINEDSAVTQSVFIQLDRFVSLADSMRTSADDKGPSLLLVAADSLSAHFQAYSRSIIETALLSSTDLEKLLTILRTTLSTDLYAIGVVRSLNDLPDIQNRTIIIRRDQKESLFPRAKILDLALGNARLLTALNRLAVSDPIDVEFYYLVGRGVIQPNLRVDMAEYNRRLSEELAQVSKVSDSVDMGDIIVMANQPVSEREAAILAELARMQRVQAADSSWVAAVLPYITRILLVTMILGVLYLFLSHFRPEIFASNQKLFAIFAVLGVQLVVIHLAELFGTSSIYLYPVAVLPVMISVLFDAEIGLFATVVLALLLGLTHRFDFSTALMTTAIGIPACFASRGVRRRGHFYRIMFLVVLSYMAFVLIFESLSITPAKDLLSEVIYGVLAGTFSMGLTLLLLPVIESVFSITTDITLLELSDLNHPLLKRLSIEAPGTYHHSIMVGNLAEGAAKAIGGNPLLARVGCYYHDIGKIEIPEYFVENQLGIKSRHEALSPSMSAMVLSSHVKRGRLLGEEADIPDDVLNFIEEHHGTLVMTYFYNKAMEQGADPTAIDKFRYPGPKPQIRETGIAMLADAVEAASRTLDDPKPARIEALIQRIMNERFQSGELNECPLTLRDLAKIKVAFAHGVIAAFHQRVHYPKRDVVA
jgi:hypothetical protein